MNIQKVNAVMDNLKNAAGDALITSSIISYAFGQSIAVYNANPKADALISRMTKFMGDSLTESRFGKVGNFFAVTLKDNKIIYVLIFEEYCWGMVFDTSKLPLGMIMNVITPDCYEEFNSILND